MTRPQGDATDAAAVFGRNVRDRRTASGQSLRAMAPLAGLRHAALGRIESGTGTTLATAGHIAGALGVPLSVLTAVCGHCLDAPRRGFTCQSCGTAGPAVTA
jgi:transcriptional regulator with XRE-family HTH domain